MIWERNEMNELTAKPPPLSSTSSSLVVAQRKPQQHRPAGCVGIFFKLFDWNRRFAKKKLFPKKLLPPARATQVSMKFNADDKLPTARHLLIADAKTDESTTSMKKKGSLSSSEQKREETKTTPPSPSVVARLMGLESMPVLHSPPPPSKGSLSSSENNNLGNTEFQPQKIQKTGISDRRPTTLNRFGAVDAFQIRNVLSRSRKRPPKLASPVKSPKTARNTSRLMDAAARILEPGLQQTRNRALTYPNSMDHQDEVMGEADLPPGGVHSSCTNCGHLLDAMLASNVPAPDDSKRPNTSSSQILSSSYPRRESEVVLLRSSRSRFYPVRQLSSYPHDEVIRSPNNQNHWTLPVDNTSSSSAFNHSSNRAAQPKISFHRDDSLPPPRFVSTNSRVSSNNNSTNNAGKDFISLNKNVRSQSSRVRAVRKTDHLLFETQTRDHPVATEDSSSFPQRNLVRKRNAPGSRRVDSPSVSSSPTRSIKNRVVTAPRFGTSSSRPNHVVKGKLGFLGDDAVNNGVGASSTSKSKARTTLSSERRRDVRGERSSNSNSGDGASTLNNLTNKESYCREKSSTNSMLMDGDALGILLQQKLKELTCQAENESANGMTPQGRTTATILQELISALTADQRPILQDEDSAAAELNQIVSSSAGDGSTDKYCQGEKRTRRSSLRVSRDHFSPGSVLDGSFSNDSCVSSSIDDSPGHNIFQSESMDLSYDDPHESSMNDDDEADISDSASSITNRRPSATFNYDNNNNNNNNNNINSLVVAHSLDHISSSLQRFTSSLSNGKSAATCFLTGYHAEEILLNMELLFGGVSESERFVDFLLGSFLDQVETLAVAAWRSSVILGFDNNSSSLRGCIFDCLVESLDIRYDRYSNCGLRTWRDKIPERMNAELLVRVFDDEVRKWAGLAGRAPDEIIEREMSHSVGKWTCFEIEEFETGAEIGHEIVQSLVDEIVADLLIM